MYAKICTMRTTLILDDELVAKALAATGAKTKTAVVRLGLERLIEDAARRRLASLRGAIPDASPGRRRRSARADTG